MITLDTAGSIGGIAGTATAVTYTITGDAVTGGVDSFKVLAQGQLGIAAAALYTVPGANQALVRSIHLSNTTGLAVTAKVFVNGTAAANQIYALTIPANGSAIYSSDGWNVYDATGAAVLAAGSIAITGDATGVGTGSIPVTVVQLQGRALSASAPSTGNALVWSGTAWAPAASVATVAALDASITIGGTATAPIISTGRADQIFTLHPPTTDVNFNGQKATNAADATNATDLATFGQLQAIVEARKDKDAVLWGTTANIALTGLGTQAGGEWTGALTAGDRIAVMNQTSSPTDGIYAAAAGAWTRVADANTGAEITNASVLILNGATFKGDTWKQSATVTTIGTDPQTWVQIAEGDPISLTAVGSVPNANAASLSGQALTLQPANATNPGVVSTTTQSFLGDKTIIGNLAATNFSGSSAGTNSGDVTIGAFGAAPDAKGASIAGQVITLQPADGTHPGEVSIGAQQFGGAKTFLSTIAASNLSGTNTGDQTISLTGDATAPGGTGALAVTVVALQGWGISTTDPSVGQDIRFGPTSYQPTRSQWNILNFGADPTANAASTLAIYNAIISCAIAAGSPFLVTSGTPTTSTAPFNITVTANAAFPSTSAGGNLIVQTTRGPVTCTFTGGTTTTVAATVIAGVAGGTILSGSIMGIVSTTQIGGVVYIPSGLYLTDQEITNSIPGVSFEGEGAASNADAGNWGFSGGSWLYYNGPIGGAILRNVPITGTAGLQAGQNLKGIRVTNLNFAASGTSLGYGYAGFGLQMISCHGFYLENLFVNECAFYAYDFTTLGAGMLSEAEDCTRGVCSNLRFRQLAKPACTDAQVSAAKEPITAGAGTNINTFAGAGSLATGSLAAAAWPTAGPGAVGLASVAAVDQLTGNVMEYLLTFTGFAGANLGITGITTLPLWWNQANATTLNAATPSSGNPKPSAVLFTSALLRSGMAAWGGGIRMHGSLTANASVNTFINCDGNHWMGSAAYLGNSDSNRFIGVVFNRTAAGTPTGIGWDVHGATAVGGASAASRNNRWYGGDAGPGGIRLRGTGEFAGTGAYTAAASSNAWFDYELGNGAPTPVVGTSATFQCTFNGALVPGGVGTPNVANQALAVATRTMITGTSIQLLPQSLQVGFTWIRFTLSITKTALGTAAWTAIVAFGAANTTADTAIATFTSGTGTAVADTGVLIIDFFPATLGAAATANCVAYWTHAGGVTAAGLSTLPAIPGATATFNSGLTNPGPAFLHIDITSGATEVFNVVGSAQVMR